jgi:hypothetical protein
VICSVKVIVPGELFAAGEDKTSKRLKSEWKISSKPITDLLDVLNSFAASI